MARQVKVHAGTLAYLAMQYHMPLGLFAEAVDHRKAQADTLAHRLGAEERLEGMFERALRHALAFVSDAQARIVAHRQAAIGELRRCYLSIAGFDTHLATVGHGFAGIEQQVVHGFLQLCVVAGHWPGVFRYLQLQ
ncbi:hypothetical protein D3C75_1086530 [compost metagenome]